MEVAVRGEAYKGDHFEKKNPFTGYGKCTTSLKQVAKVFYGYLCKPFLT